MISHAPSSSSRQPSRRLLWFAVAAPVLVWAIHSATGVLVVVQACQAGREALARGIVIGTTLAALAVAALGAVLGYRGWRRTSGGLRLVRAQAEGQSEMLGLVGLLAGVAFGIGVLWNGLPAVLLSDLCEVVR